MLPKPILQHLTLYCLLLCSVIPYLTNTQPLEIVENRPKATFPAALSSRHFAIDLDYPKAFELVITSFNGNTSSKGFCEGFPARINHRVEWNGRINTTSDEPDETGELENHSYDNIVVFNNYYFILESSSFNIIAIKDFHDRSTYYTIESEFQNQDSDEQLEDTWLIVDPNEKYLYIITRKVFLTYNLVEFFNAIKNKKPIPKIKTQDPNYPGYDMISSIKYYKHRLYIVADNVAQVHVVSKGGQITPQIKLDHDFFETDSVAISDVAFRGSYIYVLDTLKGVYVVDISRADIPDNNNVTTKYVFRADDTTEVLKGKFIAIIGDSLHVITSGAKSQYLFEYIIRGDQTFLDLEFNRKFELFQAVRESYADSNYLYLVTGFFNMVAKHSIPGRYFSPAVENFLLEYWPTMEAKTLISQVDGDVSTVVILHEDMATVMVFDEVNPRISCKTEGVKEGFYSYKLRAVQKDCPAQRNTTGADFNTVCEINQEIQLMMVDDRVIGIEQVEESKKKETYLYAGIGVLAVLVVIFVCLVRKYKNQYQRLEDRIKFHKLDNESVDQKRKQDQGDSQDINPYNINIQAELKKDEQKRKSPSPKKVSPNKSPSKKPNAEFGDLKPLDVDEIYGRKGKGNQDDDSY